MKSCPNCNRTFEDTFTFCLMDGAILSAPFDPAATNSSSAHDSAPPQTEVIRNAPDVLPLPRGATPRDFQPTIAAPFVQQPRQPPTQPFAAAVITKERPLPEIVRWMFVLRGGIAVLWGILLLLWRG